MGSIGFKEWALVCEALGRGEQTVLVRKGGIAEGRDGFAFQHREFFLFPTFFHGQLTMLRGDNTALPHRDDGSVEINFFARVEQAELVSEWDVAAALEPFHRLTPELVRERFEYDAAPGIHVAFVRIWRLATAWTFPDEKRFGGCRSWVTLPELPESIQMDPVLTDAEHEQRLHAFRSLFLRAV